MIQISINDSKLKNEITKKYGRDLFEFMNHAISEFSNKIRKDNSWRIPISILDVYVEDNEEHPLNLYLSFVIQVFNLKDGHERYGTKYIWTNTRAKDFSCQNHSFKKVPIIE